MTAHSPIHLSPLRFFLLVAAMVALGLLYARSVHHADTVALFASKGNIQILVSNHGSLRIILSSVSMDPERAMSLRWGMTDSSKAGELLATLDAAASHNFIFHSLGLIAGDASNLPALRLSGKWYSLSCPDWIPLAFLALWASRIVRRQWLWHQRRRRGLCQTCGYDLRASPDRCPECGTPSPAGGLIPRSSPPAP